MTPPEPDQSPQIDDQNAATAAEDLPAAISNLSLEDATIKKAVSQSTSSSTQTAAPQYFRLKRQLVELFINDRATAATPHITSSTHSTNPRTSNASTQTPNTTISYAPQTSSRLLSLPQELQTRIYTWAVTPKFPTKTILASKRYKWDLAKKGNVILGTSSVYKPKTTATTASALSQTCYAIYENVIGQELFYKANVFEFRTPMEWLEWGESLSDSTKAMIRHVYISGLKRPGTDLYPCDGLYGNAFRLLVGLQNLKTLRMDIRIQDPRGPFAKRSWEPVSRESWNVLKGLRGLERFELRVGPEAGWRDCNMKDSWREVLGLEEQFEDEGERREEQERAVERWGMPPCEYVGLEEEIGREAMKRRGDGGGVEPAVRDQRRDVIQQAWFSP